MPDVTAAALAYVRHVLDVLDISPSALAKKAEISATTLTRALNNPRHKFVLSTRTLEKIAKASQISPASFFANHPQKETGSFFAANSRLFAGLAEEKNLFVAPAQNRNSQQALLPLEDTSGTKIAGAVCAGKWLEFSVLDRVQGPNLDMWSSRYEPTDCFALLVHDNSMDRVAKRGEILYCVRTTAARKILYERPRQIVIVERRSKDGFKYELTARVLTLKGRAGKLSFASFDKSYKENIRLNDLAVERATVKIIGIVDWILRRPSFRN